MKMSFWVGRSAPPDSTRLTVGSPHSAAICAARWPLRRVLGLVDPPFTVGSLATIMTSTPSTTPMPVTSEAPTAKSVPQAASGDSSRNGASASSSSSMRSRAVSLPRRWCRSMLRSPPASTASWCWAARSATRSSIRARLAR
jgi:hypothetical protein